MLSTFLIIFLVAPEGIKVIPSKIFIESFLYIVNSLVVTSLPWSSASVGFDVESFGSVWYLFFSSSSLTPSPSSSSSVSSGISSLSVSLKRVITDCFWTVPFVLYTILPSNINVALSLLPHWTLLYAVVLGYITLAFTGEE